MAERKRIEKLVFKTNEFDVLIGRGKGTNNRPGNMYFRQLASERARDFQASKSSVRNKEIAKEIIDLIEAKGGRFFRPVTATNAQGEAVGAWEIVGEEARLTKVKQAMRDSLSSQKKRAQTQDSSHQSRRQRPQLPSDQGTRRGQSADGQARAQSHHQEHPVDLSSLEPQIRQQHNLLGGPSNPYNMYLRHDVTRAASLFRQPPSASSTPSYALLLAQARAEQQRLLLQQEVARYWQQQQELALYQQQLETLLFSQPSIATAQLTNPFAQHPQADTADSTAARLDMMRASLRHGESSRSSLVAPNTTAAARKRDAQEMDSEEEDLMEEERKPKATRVIPPSRNTASNRSQTLPSASIEPLGAAFHPSSEFLDTAPVAGQNLRPLIDHQTPQQGGRRDLSELTPPQPHEEKHSNSSGSEASSPLGSSVTTHAEGGG